MDGSELNTLPLSSYGGKVIDCVCGKTHVIETRDILYGANAVSGIKFVIEKFVPPGSAVLFVKDECGKRFCSAVERSVARLGYRINSHQIEGDVCPPVFAGEIEFPEDVRLIIGAGGADAAEVSKMLAKRTNLPLLLLASSPAYPLYLAPFVISSKEIPKIHTCPPPAALIADTEWMDTDSDDGMAAGFGEIISKLIALFDRQVSTLIEGMEHCPFISEQAMALIDSTIEKLEKNYFNARETAALILDHNIRFSALLQISDDYSLALGGETQTSCCLDLLFKAEQRESKRTGENRFLTASVLSKVYINALEKICDISFVAPPDNNMRAETAESFLGVSEREILSRMKRNSTERLKINEYKLREFRPELLEIIRGYDKKLSRGMRIFKRLYRDCGYSLLNYLDRTDLSLCIGLAPDLIENFTMLTQMKNMGLLDRYI